MKKFIKNILVPALFFVCAAVGCATIIVATCKSCSAQNPTSRCIQDMNQEDVDTLFNDVDNLNGKLNTAIRLLDAYRDYYYHVERLLDDAHVDADSPLLETDDGADYLDKKWLVDSLEKDNSMNWSKPVKK